MSTTDIFGYECVNPSQLDNPSLWAKHGRPPQTCLPDDAPRDPDFLAKYLGHDPSPEEFAVYSYKWFTVNEPQKELFGVPDPEPHVPAVPLPDSLGLMVGVLSILAIIAIIKHMPDLEKIR